MRYFADCTLEKLLTMTDEEIAEFGICAVNEEYAHKREGGPYAPFVPQTSKGHTAQTTAPKTNLSVLKNDGLGAAPIWLPRTVFFLSLAY